MSGDHNRYQKSKSYLDEREVEAITALAVEAGIVPWVRHEFINNCFIPTDDGMDGDHASLIQFAQLVRDQEREACSLLCETMGAEGYGTLAIAAAMRERKP